MTSPHTGSPTIWSEVQVQQLHALWAEGHPTAEIGKRMGLTKNMVIGKAHRERLAPRASPIRREQAPPPRITLLETADLKGLRVGQRTVLHRMPTKGDRMRLVWNVRCDCGHEDPVFASDLVGPTPPQSCKQCAIKLAAAKRFEAASCPGPVTKKPVLTPVAPVEPPSAPKPYVRRTPDPFRCDILPRSLTCEWITSTSLPVKKCGQPAVRGKPYCADHGAACVFTKVGGVRVRGYGPAQSEQS